MTLAGQRLVERLRARRRTWGCLRSLPAAARRQPDGRARADGVVRLARADGAPRDRSARRRRARPPARELSAPAGYFTDANGCVARAAWERVPFREVAYAEDHVLAHDMLRAGFAKVYVPGAAVDPLPRLLAAGAGCGEASTRPGRCARSTAGASRCDPRTWRSNVWGRVGADWRWYAGQRRPSRQAAVGRARGCSSARRRTTGARRRRRARRPRRAPAAPARRGVCRCERRRQADARPAPPADAVAPPATLAACQPRPIDGGRCPRWSRDASARPSRSPRSGRTRSRSACCIPAGGSRHQTFKALNDISFDVEPGEFFGIAGRNGSGKSTLLKCIAGIYGAEGDIWCRGRLSTFIELGVGFNPDLAARDNVVMNGIMMGLSPREARKRYDSVIEFAELRGVPGPQAQELLIGDARAARVLGRDPGRRRHPADRRGARGRRRRLPAEVLRRLQRDARQRQDDHLRHPRHGLDAALLSSRAAAGAGIAGLPRRAARGRRPLPGAQLRPRSRGRRAGADGERSGDGEARVVEAWVEDEHGERDRDRRRRATGSRCTPASRSWSTSRIRRPACTSSTRSTRRSSSPTPAVDNERSGTFSAGEEAVFSFTFDNVLAPGRYSPMFTLAHRGSGLDVIDRFEGAFSFVVTGDRGARRHRRPAGRGRRQRAATVAGREQTPA